METKEEDLITVKLLKSSNCGCCGRDLTDQTSVAIGIGPECIKGIYIDKQQLMDVLSVEGGIFEFKYKAGDAGAEKFHKKLSEQRAVRLDESIKKLNNLIKTAVTAEILDELALQCLSLKEGVVLSVSRRKSLEKHVRELRTRVVQQMKGYTERINYDVSPGMEGIDNQIDKMKKAVEVENSFNRFLHSLSPLRDETDLPLLGKKHEITQVDKWLKDCSSENWGANSPFYCLLTRQEKKVGVDYVSFVNNSGRRVVLSKERVMDIEDSEKAKNNESAAKAKRALDSILSANDTGNLNELYSSLSNRSFCPGVIDIYNQEGTSFVNNYTPLLCEKISNNEWAKVEEDLRMMATIDDYHLNKKLFLLEDVLSDLRIVEAFNSSVKKEGKDWSSGLRRIYGKLKNYGHWDTVTGKKKAS